MAPSVRWSVVIVLLIASNAGALSQTLRAGVSKTTVTPDLHGHTVYLAGFGHNRIATGVHDDLYVRCLALADKSTTLTLCSIDAIGLFYSDVQKIRQLFAAEAPAHAWLIVACTHVHEGPDTLGLWGASPTQSGVDPAYLDLIEHRVAATALAAVRAMRPAKLEFARDGHPLLAQLQSVDRPPFVHDPFLFVMSAVDASSGAPLATLVNFSDHPETLARANTEISADYPHWLCDYVEKHGGGTALFFNGTVGKVSALGADVALQDPESGKLAADGSWRKAELLGTLLGELTQRSLRTAEVIRVDRIAIAHKPIFVPLQNEHFRIGMGVGIFGDGRPLFTSGQPDRSSRDIAIPMSSEMQVPAGHDIQTEVDYVQFRAGNRVLAEIATVPGEIYPELVNGGITRYSGADYPEAPFEPSLRQMFRSQYQFVLGVANDELGYLIPKAEWDSEAPWLQNSPHQWYGEINSLGPDAASAVLGALQRLMHNPTGDRSR